MARVAAVTKAVSREGQDLPKGGRQGCIRPTCKLAHGPLIDHEQ